MKAARTYESELPAEERIRTASTTRPRATQSEVSLARKAMEGLTLEEGKIEPSTDVSLLYGKALKHLQMQTTK